MRGAINEGLYQWRRGNGTEARLPKAGSRFCRLSALPLPARTLYSLVSADREQRRGITMKYLRLVLLCGMASLAAGPAGAFEIQNNKASLEDGATPFTSPIDPYLNPDFSKGSSLALPYISKNDSPVSIREYGNGIAIPGPGVDRALPIWGYR
jgi:hypothetical protein